MDDALLRAPVEPLPEREVEPPPRDEPPVLRPLLPREPEDEPPRDDPPERADDAVPARPEDEPPRDAEADVRLLLLRPEAVEREEPDALRLDDERPVADPLREPLADERLEDDALREDPVREPAAVERPDEAPLRAAEPEREVEPERDDEPPRAEPDALLRDEPLALRLLPVRDDEPRDEDDAERDDDPRDEPPRDDDERLPELLVAIVFNGLVLKDFRCTK